jgi:glyoxylase-like metal-dependent hydrolase (beta-lactamase superfamily II)
VLIDRAILWLFATNTWVLARGPGGPAVVIDPAPDADGIDALAAAHDLSIEAVLVTHGHVDHVGGAGAVARRHGSEVYLHPDDAFLAEEPQGLLEAFWGTVPPGDYDQPPSYAPLAHDQILDVAGLHIEVIHTPGHTPGHCVFHLRDQEALFTGDHLFAGSIGRTDLPGGDHDALMRSMEDRVLDLPARTVVFPGHGPTTTLAAELQVNPFLEVFRQ